MSGLGTLLSGLSVALLQGGFDSVWMPPEGSTTAHEVDWLFWFIFWIASFFFAVIVVLMVLFVVRYRARPGHKEQETAHHNVPLEITWTVIPLILVIIIFWIGFKSYMDMSTPPPTAYEIQVTAQQWQWWFKYPNGWQDQELHAPKGIPVKLVMTSQDVIHSLYIPAFRLKKDVVPGRYTIAWFEADQTGEYYLFCAEYCGMEHSGMITRVIIQEPQDYLDWLSNAESFYDEMPPVEAGEQMLGKYGCVQCHHTDGSVGTGPHLNDVFGSQVRLADGSTVGADENYIRNSILDPGSQVVSGFQPVMPTFQGKIKDKEIDWIIAYLKSISQYYEEVNLLEEMPEGAAGEAKEGEQPEAAGESAAGDQAATDGDDSTAEASDTDSTSEAEGSNE
jgi:cytochrome c oxidase subunit 2